MSANVLQFALGLSTGLFTRPLEQAGDKVGEFSKEAVKRFAEIFAEVVSLEAAIEGVKFGFEKMSGTIERAAGLKQLSKLTGEGVGNLYGLQQGLESVGASGDALPEMALRISKALSGVNEMGERTTDVFAALGLNTQKLSHMSLGNQLETITTALSKSGNADAYASQLFGRFGAMDILRITRSLDVFKSTLRETSHDAGAFEKIAEAAEHFEHTTSLIKSHLAGMWAGLAEGVLPVIQTIADYFEKIDWTKMGENLGRIFFAFAEAFKQGNLAQLIALGIQAGFEQAQPFVAAFAQAFGAVLLDVGTTAISAMLDVAGTSFADTLFSKIQASILNASASAASQEADTHLQRAAELSKSGDTDGAKKEREEARRWLSESRDFSSQAENTADSFAGRAEERVRRALELMKQGPSVMDIWKNNFNVDRSQPTPATKAFNEKVDQLSTGFGRFLNDAKKENGFLSPSPIHKTTPKPDVTNLEKMGFVMGGGFANTDYARRTALSTEQTARTVAHIAEHIRPQPGGFRDTTFSF